ncbi:CopG family ribbon-helix-helix protein [Sphingomonas sanxanigenens]|uniref:Ribbon-helix-helix protein CopG domain-containing protein n=1 Tax=Sphingomonas sanxanigenens DSM 19645 = NX02 TaxID=1123269 RepID=W0AK03_9SPHN|nr:ribbon-helix-helix protein, CopG family [Sphingomonas sanxanigenens]AHE56623.1 hypothetical protein NX02_25080 [Sphingomonas sanxanigenens DSM 19645 = NX02]
MNNAAITVNLDAATLALVDAAAKARGISREALAAEAIQRFVERDAEFVAFVQEGIDDADSGNLISQEDMESWFAARKNDRAIRAAAE